jgi:hypothetical protein
LSRRNRLTCRERSSKFPIHEPFCKFTLLQTMEFRKFRILRSLIWGALHKYVYPEGGSYPSTTSVVLTSSPHVVASQRSSTKSIGRRELDSNISLGFLSSLTIVFNFNHQHPSAIWIYLSARAYLSHDTLPIRLFFAMTSTASTASHRTDIIPQRSRRRNLFGAPTERTCLNCQALTTDPVTCRRCHSPYCSKYYCLYISVSPLPSHLFPGTI